MAARLHLERAQAASQALAANNLIQSSSVVAHWRAADRIVLTDKRADGRLSEALGGIGLIDNSGVRSFPVGNVETGELMVGHVVPIRLSARDIFARGAAMFVLKSKGDPPALPGWQYQFDVSGGPPDRFPT